jgi:hypothetical protein
MCHPFRVFQIVVLILMMVPIYRVLFWEWELFWDYVTPSGFVLGYVILFAINVSPLQGFSDCGFDFNDGANIPGIILGMGIILGLCHPFGV